MPAPLIWFASAAGAAVASRVFSGVVNVTFDPKLKPAELLAAQEGWFNQPVILPGPDAIFDAAYRGLIPDLEDAAWGMNSGGVALGLATQHGRVWDGVLKASRSFPGVGEAHQLLVRGLINEADWCRMVKQAGGPVKEWEIVAKGAWAWLTIDQALPLWSRGLLTGEQLKIIIRRNGFDPEQWETLLKDASMVIPLPQDVIRFAIRDTFNPDLVASLDLNAELADNTDYRDLAAAVGVGVAKYKDRAGKERTIDVAEKFWQAHWELPSPTMAYQFLRLLRPSRIQRYKETLPADLAKDLTAISGKDVANLLKANDYAPKWRPPLAAISYLPLTRVDARRLFDAKLIDRAELKEQFLDSGYVDADADKMAKWAEQDRDLSRLRPALAANKGEILKGYQLGWLTGEAASVYLHKLTIRNLEDFRDYEALPLVAQAADALKNPIVAAWLAGVDYKVRSDLVNTGLAAIRGRLFGGMTTLDQAAGDLRQMGLTAERTRHHLDKWKTVMSGPRRTLQLRQLVGYWREGALSMGELVARAMNLGYGEKDLQVLLASGQVRLEKELARQRATAEADARKRAAAQARLVKELEAEAEKERRKLAWKAPVTTLVRWLKGGRITPRSFAAIAAVQGLRQDEIAVYLQEAATPAGDV